MKLIELVQSTPWAIVQEKLDAIHEVLYHHMHGVKIDLASVEAQIGRKLENSYLTEVTAEGIAILPVHGVMAKRMNVFMEISGGVSTELVAKDFRLAVADPKVRAIVLDIDSPGGTVDGTEALADLVYDARGQKPIVAFGNGMMCSAAFWLGSAADRIITEATGDVGSIGVVLAHYDYSRADEAAGVKRTLIYAGKYKAIGNDTEPLDKGSKDFLQERVDYLYGIFVDTIARNRGASVETVLKEMADGKIFTGDQALKAGLVDELGSFDRALSTALAMSEGRKESKNIVAQSRKGDVAMLLKKDKPMMTLETLASEHKDLFDEVFKAGADSVDVAGRKALAEAEERKKILDLVSAHFGDEEGTAFTAVVESGITAEQLKVIGANRKKGMSGTDKEEILAELKKSGPGNPGAGGGSDSHSQKDFISQVEAYRFQYKCSRTEAMQAVAKADPKAHEDWIKNKQKAQG